VHVRRRGSFHALFETAVKIEPRLPQLPSLSELLEHPRVKGIVDRVNRSTIAQRAGGFLEEMRSSLAERAGRVEIPSLTHLAERLARRLLGDPAALGPTINATGLVLGDPALAPPLAELALHAMLQVGSEYHRRDAARVQAVERALCEFCRGEAVWFASSFEGALAVVASALAGNRELAVVGADEAGDVDWRRLAARASAVLTTVQSGTHIASNVAVVMRAPYADEVDLAALASAKSAAACLIDVAPIAGILNPQQHGVQPVLTIKDRLAAGADLLVFDGAGLLGGPPCGVIIGSRKWIEPLSRHPLASMLAIDPLDVAALEAVLKLYRDDAPIPAIYQIPVWQLLSAPLANLEQRAARIASLLAEADAVESAEAKLVESPWRRSGTREWTAKSWAIELRPAGANLATLSGLLEHGPHPIAARPALAGSDVLQLDLRTVFPRWDQQIVAAFENGHESDGGTAASRV
jgi:L-seryl-tRNA(Ser) seleniumtransferase